MADRRRVALLGIGHPLRRDDAAGVEICERLRPVLRGRSDILVVSGGSAPENCVGALRAFRPDVVVIVDAARMGQPPGTLLRIEPSDPRAAGASTHTLPLPVFCEYLAGTLDCKVTLLGIEPADTSFGEGLSSEVEAAVARVASEALTSLFTLPDQWSGTCKGVVPSASPPDPLSAERVPAQRGAWRRGGGILEGRGELCSPLPSKTSSPPPAGSTGMQDRLMQGEGYGEGVGRPPPQSDDILPRIFQKEHVR